MQNQDLGFKEVSKIIESIDLSSNDNCLNSKMTNCSRLDYTPTHISNISRSHLNNATLLENNATDSSKLLQSIVVLQKLTNEDYYLRVRKCYFEYQFIINHPQTFFLDIAYFWMDVCLLVPYLCFFYLSCWSGHNGQLKALKFWHAIPYVII